MDIIMMIGSVNKSRIGRIRKTLKKVLRSGAASGLRMRKLGLDVEPRKAATCRSRSKLGRLSLSKKHAMVDTPVMMAEM